ncbi:MAG TPA: ROK family transcriptional regulator [Anaerolineae bacterium]|nr:ROK family transcriptional regulator [Anaerolineae bacterium]
MPASSKGSRGLIRDINQSLLLNLIQASGPISRADLARRSGLSPATVSGIINILVEDGLVTEKAVGDSSGGRPPIMLALNSEAGYVVGVKLTEEHIVTALTDLNAQVRQRLTVPLARADDPETVVDALSQALAQLRRTSGISRAKLRGVGVGLAGIIDAAGGVLRYSPIFDWRNVPIRQMLHKRLRVPIYLDNDVNTLTMAEKWFGAGRGVEDFLVVTIGRGIGMGIVVRGQFYRGANGGGGEFGHSVLDPSGPRCDCGKQGCLEAFVSDPALLCQARDAIAAGRLPGVSKRALTIERLIDLAQQGNSIARDIFAQAGRRLGMSIANLINILNPQLILISGEGVRNGAWMFGPLRAAVQAFAVPELLDDVEIRIEPLGDDAWARGAASLVLHELFKPPVHAEETALAA